MTAAQTTTAPAVPERKPRDDEIDVHGLTHPGKVRSDNQDHFLICALKKQVVVHQTSLPQTEQLLAEPERLAFLAMVADGVGGGAKGAEASQMALAAVTQYVTNSMRSYYTARASDEQTLTLALKEGALQCHAEMVQRGQEDPDYRGMATTLTLYLGVWPRAYLLQVGDSRCYLLRNGELTQMSRDQTMAQELMDMGVTVSTEAMDGRLGEHTLQLDRRAPDRSGGDPVGHELGKCRAALQRRTHQARLRRADPRPTPLHDLGQAGLRGSAGRRACRRRNRQHHPHRGTGAPERDRE